MQVVYWCFKNIGIESLGSEQNWFLLSAARSSLVKRLPGKMSEYFKLALSHFYEPVDLRRGMTLMLHGHDKPIMIFGRISVLLGDEGALKEIIEMKGASGTKICCLCANLVDHKSNLAECDHSNNLVSSTELDWGKISFHTDDSIKEILGFLGEKQATTNVEEFKRLQQFTGFNLSPRGALLSDLLDLKVASMVMYDWMHTYVSSGLWNLEIQLLVESLHSCGVSLDMLHEDLQAFHWPSHIKNRSMSGQNLFAHCQKDDIKCSASEALSVYSVIRHIVLERRGLGEVEGAKHAIDSYLRLSRVLDLLVNIKTRRTKASTLRDAIFSHLQAFQTAFGTTHWLPKHHYSGHLAYMYSAHKALIACFALERKHKVIKRFGGQNPNTWAKWEHSLVMDVLGIELHDLTQNLEQQWSGGLCNPSSATDVAASVLQDAVGGSGDEVQVSLQCYYAPGALCSARDVVLCTLGGQRHVGQVHFFASVGGDNFACVSVWKGLGKNMFDCSDSSPVLCALNSISDTCVYKKHGDYMVVVPNTCWSEG